MNLHLEKLSALKSQAKWSTSQSLQPCQLFLLVNRAQKTFCVTGGRSLESRVPHLSSEVLFLSMFS